MSSGHLKYNISGGLFFHYFDFMHQAVVELPEYRDQRT